MSERDDNKRDQLDGPPAPPELRTRRGIGGVVASRDAEQGANTDSPVGSAPGMGGPNAIGQRAMAVETAMGALAQVVPDPAPFMSVLSQFRAAVAQALQSSAAPGQPTALGGALTGIVAPPAPIAPPAMSGAGMPAPPPM